MSIDATRHVCATLSMLVLAGIGAGEVQANPTVIDLANVSTQSGLLLRAHGSAGTGTFGVPVAGGFDTDDDGHVDFAFSSIRASPLGRSGAGEVYLIFGDGSVKGVYDSAGSDAGILKFVGDITQEAAGSELWMDDVTGDGLGDLLIARQNYSPDGSRLGAGALTIVVGGEALRTHAETLQVVDLRTPPVALTLTTVVGASQLDRLGIWMRTGDVTGDGIADIVVGADETTELGETHRGAVYVIRGGSHLAANQTVDLADFGTTALPGDIARLRPPAGSPHHHFGATVQIGDLDGNDRGEVLIGATINRAGASIVPDGVSGSQVDASGGATDGTLYVAWDDNFTGVWANGFEFEVTSGPGSYSAINGATCNVSFGEEILGGLDYDDDGNQDLFVGDIVGNCGPVSLIQAGSGHVFYDASGLKGLDFDLQSPPMGVVVTDIFGAAFGDIASDTAFHGDFDGDGVDDLGVTSPHADPFGRINAGALHVLFGKSGGWPAEIDLAAIPAANVVRVTEVDGANGNAPGDTGDVLGYSAAAGDLNGDGLPDIITNEMVGNGVLPAAVDDGNLIVLSGRFVAGGIELPSLRPIGLLAVVAGLVGWSLWWMRSTHRPSS